MRQYRSAILLFLDCEHVGLGTLFVIVFHMCKMNVGFAHFTHLGVRTESWTV